LLFFLLKIPQVIGDLSGRTARKAIANIREQNEQTGDKTHKVSVVNRSRGRVTDKITRSGRLEAQMPPMSTGVETAELEQGIPTSAYESGSEETTVLNYAPQSGSEETTVLSHGNWDDTVVLDSVFEIEFDITYIHTNEKV
jgi:hypothetical protein